MDSMFIEKDFKNDVESGLWIFILKPYINHIKYLLYEDTDYILYILKNIRNLCIEVIDSMDEYHSQTAYDSFQCLIQGTENVIEHIKNNDTSNEINIMIHDLYEKVFPIYKDYDDIFVKNFKIL